MRSASKSTPAPTTKSSIAPIMLARSVWPALSRLATTTSCEVPAGNCAARAFEAKPSKMMFVASPRIFGAITASRTPIDPMIDTKMNAKAWGFSSPIRRPKLLPKFDALPGATLSHDARVQARLLGELELEALFLCQEVGGAHASTPSCDSTISL